MIDWKRKLTSRKWWMSIITLISGLIMAFGVGEDKATIITGCLMAAASCLAYTIGEGFADASAAETQNEITTDELKTLIKEAMNDDQDNNT